MTDIVLNIKAVFTSIDAKVADAAKAMNGTMDKIFVGTTTLEASQDTFQKTYQSSIRAISSIQLLRFSMKDIQDLASGKGGFGDILSLATNLLIITHNIISAQQVSLVYETALAAIKAVSATIGGGPTAILGIGIVAGATYAGISAFQGFSNQSMYADQRLRISAYRSVVGN